MIFLKLIIDNRNMTKLITALMVWLVPIVALAQEKADIEVSYTAFSPSLKTLGVEIKNNYVLLANSGGIKIFFSHDRVFGFSEFNAKR